MSFGEGSPTGGRALLSIYCEADGPKFCWYCDGEVARVDGGLVYGTGIRPVFRAGLSPAAIGLNPGRACCGDPETENRLGPKPAGMDNVGSTLGGNKDVGHLGGWVVEAIPIPPGPPDN